MTQGVEGWALGRLDNRNGRWSAISTVCGHWVVWAPTPLHCRCAPCGPQKEVKRGRWDWLGQADESVMTQRRKNPFLTRACASLTQQTPFPQFCLILLGSTDHLCWSLSNAHPFTLVDMRRQVCGTRRKKICIWSRW